MTDPTDPDTYQARERALIEQLAVTVIADPKSTDEERASARSRLQGGGETAPDANRLTSCEIVIWSALSRKLHSAFTTPTAIDDWIDREYVMACQALAAAARGEVVHPVATPRYRTAEILALGWMIEELCALDPEIVPLVKEAVPIANARMARLATGAAN